MGSSVQHVRAVKDSGGRVTRRGVRALERGQLHGLAHYPSSRSTGRGTEALVSDSPVEMLPVGDGGTGEKCDSRKRPNGTKEFGRRY